MDAAFLAADEKLEIGFFGDKVSAVIHEHFISHGGKGFADGEIERTCILFYIRRKTFCQAVPSAAEGHRACRRLQGWSASPPCLYGNGLLCGLHTIRKSNPAKLVGFDAVGINAVHACGKSILKDAVAIDGVRIDLEPLCLQLGDIFLLCAVDMQG